MKHYRPIGNVDGPSTGSAPRVVVCPACNAQLAFNKSLSPRIDACGFESYSIECKECGAPLVGIVDPFDDTLLLSELAA